MLKKKVVLFVSCLLIQSLLFATTFTFLSDGSWEYSPNWDVYPGQTISQGDTVILAANANFESGSIIINGVLINEGSFTFDYDPKLEIGTNGKLINNNNISGQFWLTNYGFVENNNNLSARFQDNYSSGIIENYGSWNSSGGVSDESFINNDGEFHNFGFFSNNIYSEGPFYNYETAEIILKYEGGALFKDLVINEGEITSLITDDYAFFQVQGGELLNNGQIFQFIEGNILIDDSSISGEGQFFGGNIDFDNCDISPGNSPGIIEFNNPINHNGTISIEIEGPSTGIAGMDYDQIQVNDGPGSAFFNCDLSINTSLFEPNIGDTYRIISGDDYNTSSNLSIPQPLIASGKQWTVEYLDDGIYITVIPGPLPIEIQSFTGFATESFNVIKWTTLSEINNDIQILEKSTEAILDWQEVNRVQGHINSTTKKDYEVIDQNPSRTTFYRVRSIDLDGSSTTSEIIVVVNELINNVRIELLQNPVSAQSQIAIYNIKSQKITLKLFNRIGQEIFSRKFFIDADQQLVDLLGSQDLSKGMYYLFYEVNGEFGSVKFTKI